MIRQKLLVIFFLMLLPLGANAQWIWSKYLVGIYDVPGHDVIGLIPVCIDYEYDDWEQEGSENYNNYTCWVTGKYENYENLDEYGFPQLEQWTHSGDVYIPSKINIQYDENNPEFIVSTPFYMNETYTITGIGSEAFLDCTGLTSVNMPTSITTIGWNAFSGCTGLTSITIPNGVTMIGDQAFDGCSNLNEVIVNCSEPPTICSNTFPNRKNTKLYVPNGCKPAYAAAPYWKEFRKIVEIGGPEDYVWLSSDSTTLTFCYDSQRAERIGTTFDLNALRENPGKYELLSVVPEWANEEIAPKVTQVTFNSSFAIFRPKTTNRWFYEMTNLNTITGIQYLNTENVADMYNMFGGCKSLSILDVTGFDTKNVEDMSAMFYDCINLTVLDVSGFNTSKVKRMSSMFSSCSKLTQIDVGGFDTEKVGTMDGMFRYCNNLTHIDVDKFNTTALSSMGYMFLGCSKLTRLDLSNFDLDHGDYAYWVSGAELAGCTSLKELKLSLSVMNKIVSCGKVGTPDNPCLLYAPDGYDFGDIDTSNCFQWKNGYFKLGKYTDLAAYDNVIYIDEATVKNGAEATLSVMMNNTLGVRGFQFDIVLPEGVTAVTDEDGLPLVSLSTERTTAKKMNFFDSAVLSDGTIRVLCNSNGGYTFDGTSGEVCTIAVNVADGLAAGLYSTTVRGIVLTDVEAIRYPIDGDIVTRLNVEDFYDGDANEDGTVDVADLAITANYILGRDTNNFLLKAADINNDGAVDVSDLAAIANIILHGKASAPARIKTTEARNDVRMEAAPLTISAGATAAMTISLSNPMEGITSWQTDLSLPEGVMVEKIRMADARRADHTIDWQLMADGTTRILCISTSNRPLKGTEGTVAIVTLRAENDIMPGIYDVALGNAILTGGSNRLETPEATSFITVAAPTGINFTVDDQVRDSEYFTTGGARLSQPQRGITIIRDANGQVRKQSRK